MLTEYNLEYLEAHAVLKFLYGSVVYGTITDKSDVDVICVVEDGCADFSECEGGVYEPAVKDERYDYHFITEDRWLDMIDEHHIYALEGLFLSDAMVLKGSMGAYLPMLKLDKWLIRKTISSISSNAWAKCHKKMTVEKDYDMYRAKKSLFHALRLFMYGRQLAEYGHIVSYTAANHIWDEIYGDESDSWEHYKEKYKPMYNSLKSEMVALCEKPKT